MTNDCLEVFGPRAAWVAKIDFMMQPDTRHGAVCIERSQHGSSVKRTSGCMPLKKTLAEMDWNTLVILAAAQGFAKGLDVSGGGQVLADAVLAPFGGQNASIPVVTAVICLLCSALTLFMQNSGVAAMITPVVIPMAISH